MTSFLITISHLVSPIITARHLQRTSLAFDSTGPTRSLASQSRPTEEEISEENDAQSRYDRAQADVRKIDALDRTIEQWRLLVDWNLQRQRPMVVIDPNDPEGILYMTEKDYRDLQKVCLSNDLPLTVIARPGTKPPTSWTEYKSSQTKTPPHVTIGEPGSAPPRPRALRNRVWAVFHRMKSWIPNLVKTTGDGQIELDREGKTLRSLTFVWGRETLHYCELGRLGLRYGWLATFGNHLAEILLHQGHDQLIKRLKIYLFVLNSYVGSDPMKNTHSLGVRIRLRHGLPAAFPREVRDAIRSGSLPVIRWWASILNMYKALKGVYGTIPLETIAAPPFIGDTGILADHVLEIWEALCEIVGEVPHFVYQSAYGRVPRKSGPITRVALEGLAYDAYVWSTLPRNYPMELLALWGDYGSCMKMQEAIGNVAIAVHDYFRKKVLNPSVAPTFFMGQIREQLIGKLAYKLEAAGKIRIFAIVDYWTHMVCKPLHDFLLHQVLAKLPTDATFDQNGRLQEFVDKCHESGITAFWCYDLKSATDLIPVSLYVEVLTPILGRKVAELWAALLTDRWFKVSPAPKGGGSLPDGAPERVRYSRGQPMGALSSWPGLAIVHHFLVQLAWRLEGGDGWFIWYLVLGDDIVIANQAVAERYLKLCEYFGIQVGLAKSFVSLRGFLNFANQSYLGRENISPISLKEEISARGWAGRIALAARIMSRWYPTVSNHTALLKRVVPAPLWELLQSELQRSESVGMLRTLDLLVRNPLAGAKEVGTEEVVNWLETYVLSSVPPASDQRLALLQDLFKIFENEAEAAIRSARRSCEDLREVIIRIHKVNLGTYHNPGFWQIFADLLEPWLTRTEEAIDALPGRDLRDAFDGSRGAFLLQDPADFQDWTEAQFEEALRADREEIYSDKAYWAVHRWVQAQALTPIPLSTIKAVRKALLNRKPTVLSDLLGQVQESIASSAGSIRIPIFPLERLLVRHYGVLAPFALLERSPSGGQEPNALKVALSEFHRSRLAPSPVSEPQLFHSKEPRNVVTSCDAPNVTSLLGVGAAQLTTVVSEMVYKALKPSWMQTVTSFHP